MPQFTVDQEVAALVEQLAKPKPFENLSFNAALVKILGHYVSLIEPKKHKVPELEQLLAESMAAVAGTPKKVPSPSAADWISTVPELKSKKALTTWKAVCDFLKIETAGDSARRKLKNWVKANRPSWPAVPDIE